MSVKDKVIAKIIQQHAQRFRVVDNTGDDKKIVGGQFPDLIFLQLEPPPNNNVLYVLKIETGENLVDSMAEWKALSGLPSVFYAVVPKAKLDEAKKLAAAINIKARFAWYVMNQEEVAQIKYE